LALSILPGLPPPRDEFGLPLYGDVAEALETAENVERLSMERELWGRIEDEEEEEEEEEEVAESEDETKEVDIMMEDMDDIPGGVAFQPTGAEMFSGIASTFAPIPESLELKKSRFDIPPQTQSQDRQELYRVLPETQTKKGSLRSTGYEIHTPLNADIPKNVSPPFCPRLISQKKGVDVSLDPSEPENWTMADLLNLDNQEMKKDRAKTGIDGFSDNMAELESKEHRKGRLTEEKKKPKYRF